MKYQNMSQEHSIKVIKQRRKSISPNLQFMKQLKRFEEILVNEKRNI